MEQTSLPIKDLAAKVDRGEFKIPEMQRGYVWTSGKVAALMDSLYRGYPTGSILTWANTNKEIRQRNSALDNNNMTQERLQYQLLLDGQQRLTSLTALIRNKDLIVKNRKRPIDILFNLEHDDVSDVHGEINDNDSDFDDIDEDESDVYDLSDASDDEKKEEWQKQTFAAKVPKLANKKEWISVKDIFSNSSEKELLKDLCSTWEDPNYIKYSERIKKVKKILDYQYNITVVDEEKSYDEVTDIFIRINSAGTKLKSSDLALAHITTKWQGSREIFEEFQQECAKHNFGYNDLGIFVKTLVSFITGQCRYDGISKISKEDFQDGWEISKKGINHAIDLLRSNIGIINGSLLSSPFILIPISYYLHRINFSLDTASERKLKYWALAASAKGRYSRGSSEGILNEDLAVIKKQEPSKALDIMIANLTKQIGRLNITEVDLIGRYNNSSYFKTMFIVFKEAGAKDWNSGINIDLNYSNKENKLEYHHIFPKSKLKIQQYEKDKINDISNLVFIAGKLNRVISNKEPSDYLYKIDPELLKKQCVPIDKELWKIKNYEKFLEARRKLIAEELDNFIQKNNTHL